MSLNVTAHYALLALGEVRLVSWVNVLAALVMLLAMAVLAPRWGIQGAATARLLYGPVTFILYFYLYKIFVHAEPAESPVFAAHAVPENG
jgi:O-antigen/teichoic acid export membrane protein